jgi:hypothetical protein
VLIEREKEIMTLFDVTVNNKDTIFHETFRVFATCKREAMMKGIRIARLCDNVKGELFAVAKVVR